VFPGHHPEHQIRAGYLFFIDFGAGFLCEPGRTIPAGFGYGPLIDFAHRGQDYVVLMICDRVSETTVGILAEVYFF
jgi:hypothetical protein